MKPQKHDVLPNRLESIQQEHARQEKIRKQPVPNEIKGKAGGTENQRAT